MMLYAYAAALSHIVYVAQHLLLRPRIITTLMRPLRHAATLLHAYRYVAAFYVMPRCLRATMIFATPLAFFRPRVPLITPALADALPLLAVYASYDAAS